MYIVECCTYGLGNILVGIFKEYEKAIIFSDKCAEYYSDNEEAYGFKVSDFNTQEDVALIFEKVDYIKGLHFSEIVHNKG